MSTKENQEELLLKMQSVARDNNLSFRAILDTIGGSAWLNYSHIEDNDYTVQISTGKSFDVYKKIRDDCCAVFESVDSVLADEHDFRSRITGFQRELLFMDRAKYEEMRSRERAPLTVTNNNIGTQFNGDVAAGGGNINTGNAATIDNSTTIESSDEKWFQKEIVKMVLSFIGGVGATLFAQWIMRLLGWIG